MAKVLAKDSIRFKLIVYRGAGAVRETSRQLRDIVNQTSTPIALGERSLLRAGTIQAHPRGRYVDIITARRVTRGRHHRMPEDRFDGRKPMTSRSALHCPLGPIALATCLQLDAVSYNAFKSQEQSLGIHYNQGNDLLRLQSGTRKSSSYEGGYVSIPQGPGLEHRLNEEKAREMAKSATAGANPVWRHTDGSVAEW